MVSQALSVVPAGQVATAGQSDAQLFPLFANVAAWRVSNFKTSNVANTVWAFAKLRSLDTLLFAALTRVAEQRMDDFDVHQLSSTVWAFATICDGLRLWCMNGCTPVNASTLRFKHTTNVNIQSITDRVKTGLDFFRDSSLEYYQWSKTPLANNSVQRFLEQTLCKTFKRSSNSIPYKVIIKGRLSLDCLCSMLQY